MQVTTNFIALYEGCVWFKFRFGSPPGLVMSACLQLIPTIGLAMLNYGLNLYLLVDLMFTSVFTDII